MESERLTGKWVDKRNRPALESYLGQTLEPVKEPVTMSEVSIQPSRCFVNTISNLSLAVCRLIFFPQGDDLGTEWSQLFRHYVDSYYICPYIINVVGQFS